jgi:outer membrane protein assembly factor BamB
LPDRLPGPDKILWRKPLPSKGLGGVAATSQHIIVSARDFNDTQDLWRCLDATTGATIWSVRYPAPGNLDFGNSPRATPLVHDGIVFCYGAFGHLHAIDLKTGKVLWKHDTCQVFAAPADLPWGLCSSPLIAGGKLILYIGGPDAALVAFAPKTGEIVWKTSGAKPAYGSFLAGTFGGVEQVVGYDATTLGGWDVATGKRLWTLTPDRPKDFNVPTPLAWNGHIIVNTENNATRMYRFGDKGMIDPKPVARDDDLRPDTHTPIVFGNRLFGVHGGLHCLDLANGLKSLWVGEDDSLGHYTAAIASPDRVLLVTMLGEALMIDANAHEYKVLDRKTLVEDEGGLFAHPAIVGTRMYLRSGDAITCYSLE